MAAMEAIKRLLSRFGASSVLMKIVWVNIAVFVALRLAAIVCLFAGKREALGAILATVELPSSPWGIVMRPWTVITYMFSQYDVFHILFNMIWLYWFGTLFGMASSQRRLLPLYLYGGLAGAALFVAVSQLLPGMSGGALIGSSAAVIAIVTATAIMMPDFEMNLFLIGAVKLKWIAIVTIGLVFLGVAGPNMGGEVAHVGGILVGVWYALSLRRGVDITDPCCRLLDSLAGIVRNLRRRMTRKGTPSGYAPRTPAGGSAPSMPPADREELDRILDKIKRSGYSALSPDERKRLFDVSRNIK